MKAKLEDFLLHCFRENDCRLVYHKYGCIIKGTPCDRHKGVSIPSDILKVPLISIPKRKQLINDRVEFKDNEPRYLSIDTWKDFGCYEPLPKLKSLIRGKEMKLYDSEKDRISGINALQPNWESPSWSPEFDQKMRNAILKNPMNREAAERWMVDQITQKNVYIKWKKLKQEKVEQFIKSLGNETILRNVKLIFEKESMDNIPIGNTISITVREFAVKHLLKEQDVYVDLRNYAMNKYKDIDMDLIDLQELDTCIDDNNKQTDVYYQYKSLFKMTKCDFID